MPHALLTPTKLRQFKDTHSAGNPVLDEGKFGFWIWESLFSLDGCGTFDSLYVVEGCSGLFIPVGSNLWENIADGTVHALHLATYHTPQKVAAQLPDCGFPLSVNVRRPTSTFPLIQLGANQCAIGLKDLLKEFDALVNGKNVLDKNRDLPANVKQQLKGKNLALKVSNRSGRQCISLDQLQRILVRS